jgi:hypothetical protein
MHAVPLLSSVVPVVCTARLLEGGCLVGPTTLSATRRRSSSIRCHQGPTPAGLGCDILTATKMSSGMVHHVIW